MSTPSVRMIHTLAVATASLLLVVAVGGCASTPMIPVDEVMATHAKIAELQDGLKEAMSHDADILAPEGYEAAVSKLGAAIESAQAGKAAEADTLAAEGLSGLSKANTDAAQSSALLREALEVRQRAEAAGAWQVMSDKANEVDGQLRATAIMIEKGEIDAAKKNRQTLIDGYADLELASLKEGAVEVARQTIAQAEEDGAKKLAPKTFKLAQDEMGLATAILDADRTDTDRANMHAARAKSLAKQSGWIAELIKDFDRRDFTREDSVLWYQSQLSEIYEPVGDELSFDRPNRKVVLDMQEAYAGLIAGKAAIAKSGVQQQEELEEQLSLTQAELMARTEIEAARQARFEAVQSLFTKQEATVYRQRQNVLISAHGFHFPSGESEIKTDNFVLAKKVIEAIEMFPQSTVEISGHTDSTGGAKINQEISTQRAANVLKFLNEVGGVPLDRLSSAGYGKERPVASNETAAGRAENRRVEILINNN